MIKSPCRQNAGRAARVERAGLEAPGVLRPADPATALRLREAGAELAAKAVHLVPVGLVVPVVQAGLAEAARRQSR